MQLICKYKYKWSDKNTNFDTNFPGNGNTAISMGGRYIERPTNIHENMQSTIPAPTSYSLSENKDVGTLWNQFGCLFDVSLLNMSTIWKQSNSIGAWGTDLFS